MHHTVLRVVGAVYETLSPLLTEMKQELATEMREGLAALRENLTTIQQQVNSLTETVSNMEQNSNSKLDSLDSKLDGLSMTLTMVHSELERNVLTNVTKELKKTADYILELAHTYECGGTGGWRRVVYLNMTDPNTNCPSGWQRLTSYSKTTCGKVNTSFRTCDSAFFSVSGGNYTSVCGSIIAYQYGPTDAFEPWNDGRDPTIERAYVSGVSLTHGSRPRQHIWTFAAGISEATPSRNDACPCDASINITIPPFVGGDYFCESGVNSGSTGGFHPDDPLWDGEGCGSSSSCCSFNNPPYFTKILPSPTSDPIEARRCRYNSNEDTPVEFMELYVK